MPENWNFPRKVWQFFDKHWKRFLLKHIFRTYFDSPKINFLCFLVRTVASITIKVLIIKMIFFSVSNVHRVWACWANHLKVKNFHLCLMLTMVKLVKFYFIRILNNDSFASDSINIMIKKLLICFCFTMN